MRTGMLFIVLLSVLLSGCVTITTPPEWVNSPPAETAEVFYFIGIGSDTQGNAAAAREQAGYNLVGDVTRFLGVQVTAETTVKAKDYLGKFESEITQNIQEISGARIADFKVLDTYQETLDDGTVVVYLLGSYGREALLLEKERLQALFQERLDAVSVPEAKGDAALARGDGYNAAVLFIEAAAAAASGRIENADVKIQRNLTKARNAIAGISLIGERAPISGFLQEELSGPFSLTVSIGENCLKDVPFIVNYVVRRDTGKKAVETDTARSDTQGVLTYHRSPAAFVGTDTLTISLDLRSDLETLEILDDSYLDLMDSLKQEIREKQVTFQYTIQSRAALIPTAVMVLDVDRSGNPVPDGNTAAGILETLTAAGFNIVLISVNPELFQLGDFQIIETVRESSGGKYKRLIFGEVKIDDYRDADHGHIVKVSGSIKVVDLESGRILLTDSRIKSSRGSRPASTISAAFNGIGQNFGEQILNSLR